MTEAEKQAIKSCRLLLNGDISLHILDDDRGTAYCGEVNKLYNKDLETVLNLIEKQQAEIEKYKEMYAVSVADRVNNAFKQEYKNNEDLEMLYKGCQIELEEKDKIIDEMAEKIYQEGIVWESKEDVKEYFKKKVVGKM